MSCNPIHNPRVIKAGTLIKKAIIKTRTWFFGNIRRYPPNIPDMAPDAPRLGIKRSLPRTEDANTWQSVAIIPVSK